MTSTTALYGCEILGLSPLLREEYRFKIFGNGMLRKISGTKRPDSIRGPKEMHD
jgi:hypothetical protein